MVGHHHHDSEDRGHIHGVIDPSIATTQRGIWAVKWSFAALMVTALLQLVVVIITGSVALLADTVHNFGDAATAIPLGIAFLLARRRPGRRFTYGYGKAEDLAGVIIVLIILGSAVMAGYQSVLRLLHPRDIDYVWAVGGAGAIGFLGNELVALFRIKVGKEISSAALVADGYHARVDGLTSLAVLAGAVAVGLGFPVADPVVGLVITVLIGCIVWQSAKAVFSRMLDGVEPELVQAIEHTTGHVAGVLRVTDVRARWVGHRLEAEVHLTVPPMVTIETAHALTVEIGHQLSHAMPFIANTMVHVDPVGSAGIHHHHVVAHEHDGLPMHAH